MFLVVAMVGCSGPASGCPSGLFLLGEHHGRPDGPSYIEAKIQEDACWTKMDCLFVEYPREFQVSIDKFESGHSVEETVQPVVEAYGRGLPMRQDMKSLLEGARGAGIRIVPVDRWMNIDEILALQREDKEKLHSHLMSRNLTMAQNIKASECSSGVVLVGADHLFDADPWPPLQNLVPNVIEVRDLSD